MSYHHKILTSYVHPSVQAKFKSERNKFRTDKTYIILADSVHEYPDLRTASLKTIDLPKNVTESKDFARYLIIDGAEAHLFKRRMTLEEISEDVHIDEEMKFEILETLETQRSVIKDAILASWKYNVEQSSTLEWSSTLKLVIIESSGRVRAYQYPNISEYDAKILINQYLEQYKGIIKANYMEKVCEL